MNGQRIEGFNDVTYTPVEAYGVSTYDSGVISGGLDDGNTVVGSARFIWVYNPDSPETSGFTGGGHWHCGVPNTPLETVPSDDVLMEQFERGERTNLNNEFEKWQAVVNGQPEDSDYVGDFIGMVGLGCVNFNNN